MSDLQDKKPRQIEIAISSVPPDRSVYANTYTLEKTEDHLIFYFAFQSDNTNVSTKVTAISVSVNDLVNQKPNWERYLEQTAPIVESLGPYRRPIRGVFAVDSVEAATVVQMARLGMTAEISFSLFVLHEVVLWKVGQPKIVAQRNLTVRCSLHMQTDLIFKILELLNVEEEDE